MTTSRQHPLRVVYWNNIPAPYMVDRFNALVRRGNIELEAWFGARTEPDRAWTVDEETWAFPFQFLPQLGARGRRMSLPTPVLTTSRPDLLVSLYATPSFLAGLRLAWWRGWRTALWVETTFDSWVRRSPWKEALKRVVFSRVDGIITAGLDGREFALRYGARADTVDVVRHVVDVERIAANAAQARGSREDIRAALGVAGVVYLYVGRLWRGKGILDLIDAYAAVARQSPVETSLLVVGDGPETTTIERARETHGVDITVTGFHQQDMLSRFYAAADVFVFPTLGDPYGLVVDEAMAAGLPVISTTAAGEIRERVIDSKNGFLIPPADPKSLARAMLTLAGNAPMRADMAARSAELIGDYTLDRWAETFEGSVERIVARTPMRNSR